MANHARQKLMEEQKLGRPGKQIRRADESDDVRAITFIIMIPTRFNPRPGQERGDEVPRETIEHIKHTLQENVGAFSLHEVERVPITIMKGEGEWTEPTHEQFGPPRRFHDPDALRIFINLPLRFAAKAWDYLTISAREWAEKLDQEAIYLEANGQGENRQYSMRRPGDEQQAPYTNPFRRPPSFSWRLLRRMLGGK